MGVSIARFSVHVFATICLVALALLLPGLGCNKDIAAHDPGPNSALIREQHAAKPVPSETLPPDVSRCERIRIWLAPSTVDFVCVTPLERPLLNPEEIRYLESAAPFIVDSLEVIQTFAKDISSSTYVGPVRGISGVQYQILFTCYERSGREISFKSIGNIPEVGNTLEADGRRFENNGIHWRTLVPQVVPFQLRVACKFNLDEIHAGLRYYLDQEKSYPPAIEWYDAMLHRYEVKGYTTNVARLSKAISCPSAGEGKSHYAMNPNCKPDSPADMVLLFETKAGWNQHGGPELFTFDNHKGGCVLFNDGTVKFIRTKEELQQLRWK
jgi:hypothetical protein